MKRKDQFQRETLNETWNWPRTFKIFLRIFLFVYKSTKILSTLCRPWSCVNNKPLLFQVNFLFLPPRSTQIFSNTVHGYCWSPSLGVGRGANNASPWKNIVKKYSQGEVLPLETKQSGGKLLPHSDLRGEGVFVGEVSRSRKRDFF